MRLQAFLHAGCLALLIALSGCGRTRAVSTAPGEGLTDAQAARDALVTFFDHLYSGNYEAAADLYCGPYDVMIDHNPGLDPEDHAGLFRAACTINGAVCLEVAGVRQAESGGMIEGEFTFLVQFQDADGLIFVLGECCGAGAGEGVSAFPFRVRKTAEYLFQVIDQPIYQP